MKKVLDITKEHCPMTFVKTKIELSKLNEGDILEVWKCYSLRASLSTMFPAMRRNRDITFFP